MRKHILFFLFCSWFLFGAIKVSAFSGPGIGTSESPFIVLNCVQLQELGDNVSAHYKLGADIDCADTANWNGFKGYGPIGNSEAPFTGELDGDSHTISNLTSLWSDSDYVGLFGSLNNAEVHDIHFIDSNISGHDYVGGVAGYALNSNISNITLTGIINGHNSVGGLIGSLQVSTLITSSASTTISAASSVGGLVGLAEGVSYPGAASFITQSFSLGQITATGDMVGGLVGQVNMHAKIENCYSKSNVSGVNQIGGMAGALSALAYLHKSYSTGRVSGTGEYINGGIGLSPASETLYQADFWDVDTSEQSDSGIWLGVITGTSTGAMKTRSVFTNAGWDFDEVWGINNYALSNNNNGYPFLRWQGLTDLYFNADVDSYPVDASATLIADEAVIGGHMDVADDWTWEKIDALNDTRLYFQLIYGTTTYPNYIYGGLFPANLNLYSYYPNYVNDFTPDDNKPDLNDVYTSFTLTNLTCDTTYYYRLIGGLSRYPRSVTFFGDELSFQTGDCTSESATSTEIHHHKKYGSLPLSRAQITEIIDGPNLNENKTATSTVNALISTNYSTLFQLIFNRDLYLGLIGGDVRALQDFLIKQHSGKAAEALAENGATGFFGLLTKSALVEFQLKNNLKPAVGFFGPITRSFIQNIFFKL